MGCSRIRPRPRCRPVLALARARRPDRTRYDDCLSDRRRSGMQDRGSDAAAPLPAWVSTARPPSARSRPAQGPRSCSARSRDKRGARSASAASQAAGLRENFGTMTKPFHAGRACESGVVAAEFARSDSPHRRSASRPIAASISAAGGGYRRRCDRRQARAIRGRLRFPACRSSRIRAARSRIRAWR